MELADFRRALIWGVGAFFLTVVHPMSVKAGLIITVIASIAGAVS